MVTDWSNYQEEAATLFRSMGLDASTNVTIQGVRTKHDVDVIVKSHHAGFDVTWLVECKRWKSPVSKLYVLHFAKSSQTQVLIGEYCFAKLVSRVVLLRPRISQTAESFSLDSLQPLVKFGEDREFTSLEEVIATPAPMVEELEPRLAKASHGSGRL